MSRFDWPALMRAGMQSLRLTPEQFWALTPAELRLMLGQSAGQTPMGREGLNALLAAYPDVGPNDDRAGPEQGDDDE